MNREALSVIHLAPRSWWGCSQAASVVGCLGIGRMLRTSLLRKKFTSAYNFRDSQTSSHGPQVNNTCYRDRVCRETLCDIRREINPVLHTQTRAHTHTHAQSELKDFLLLQLHLSSLPPEKPLLLIYYFQIFSIIPRKYE